MIVEEGEKVVILGVCFVAFVFIHFWFIFPICLFS